MTISEHFMLKKLSFFEAAAQLGVICIGVQVEMETEEAVFAL